MFHMHAQAKDAGMSMRVQSPVTLQQAEVHQNEDLDCPADVPDTNLLM